MKRNETRERLDKNSNCDINAFKVDSIYQLQRMCTLFFSHNTRRVGLIYLINWLVFQLPAFHGHVAAGCTRHGKVAPALSRYTCCQKDE